MKVSIENFSPVEASYNMEKNNVTNRKLDKNWGLILAREMKEGRFIENGDSLKFCEDGTLLDGQHRLFACIESGCTFSTVVVRNLKRDALFTDDRKPRTLSQSLQFKGMEFPTLFSSVATIINNTRSSMGETRQGRLPQSAAMEFVADNIRSLEYSRVTVGSFKKGIISNALAMALHYLFTETKSDKADIFIRQLLTGLELKDGSPVWYLRNALLNDMKSTKHWPHSVKIALIIKAWNAFNSNQDIKVLKFSRENEAYPKIQ